MKKLILALFATFAIFAANAQSPIGAWESFETLESGQKIRMVVIFTEDYQVLTTFDAETGAFIDTNGGSWSLDGDVMTEVAAFNSDSSTAVGKKSSFKIILTDAILEIPKFALKFTRIDDGKPGELQGAWLMSGRIVDGKEQKRDITGPQKTMKILSGKRFQWIAYHTETKEFLGTGGGTYTTENGRYTENIEFFSKDNTKVGLKLGFDYLLENAVWKHSGFSSKGAPINEIWVLRK
ncbi:membrane or secreted protein [Frigoriflavimonas asaccharolytica]|uniref:Membrane or secreted protein n=1 Tax=Frigoriflavimonas asaccharolytica TaxID=2735899 RepID=A0A8J8GB61_9FLAO|nr:membrane or secreted protein [Frigoriflavimonas asaccharolytica]NRS93995.1 hypothetical protein [Frigoriflavimonas asaccharolytica]